MVVMPRQLRIDYPGAIHHVMSRGDRRENIYDDDVDRQDFLKTLAEAQKGSGHSLVRFEALQMQGEVGKWWSCHVNCELIIRERSIM